MGGGYIVIAIPFYHHQIVFQLCFFQTTLVKEH